MDYYKTVQKKAEVTKLIVFQEGKSSLHPHRFHP